LYFKDLNYQPGKAGGGMKTSEIESRKLSFWQEVFRRSIINGAPYHGDELPGGHWSWPQDTYLQRRLREVRWHQASEKADLNCMATSRAASFS
jgi:hypothetical protein